MSKVNASQAVKTFVHDATSSHAKDIKKAKTKDYDKLEDAIHQKGLWDPDSQGVVDELQAMTGRPGYNKQFSDDVKQLSSMLGVKDPM